MKGTEERRKPPAHGGRKTKDESIPFWYTYKNYKNYKIACRSPAIL